VAEVKPKSIQLSEFTVEPIPSGRKLLHCIFKDKFGNLRYVWTPPWKGESGVVRLLLKALEIEEWNDYDGAWTQELRKAAQEIPSLEEMRLPVKIRLGSMTELPADEEGPGTYKVAVEVLSDDFVVWKLVKYGKEFICIGDLIISCDSLSNFLLGGAQIKGVSRSIEKVTVWRGDERIEMRPVDSDDWEDLGVRFYVWLESGADKSEYEVIGREFVSYIRSFIRKRLSDYKALKRGFDELP